MYADWKESIQPLLEAAPSTLNPKFFGVEHYFAAKTLIASRSFEIDDNYGSGMVPLADLFNHKTAAEDVHFTLLSQDGFDDGADDDEEDTTEAGDKSSDMSPFHNHIEEVGSSSGSDSENSSATRDDPTVLEMIMVKNVRAGNEVFNTYGSLGNAALLHRYGFTEVDNPYDIVNLDLELVLEWSHSLFSRRYSRRRLLLWRKLGYSGCIGENSEYFEVTVDGEPQVELLVLLHIMVFPEEAFHELDLLVASSCNFTAYSRFALSQKINIPFWKGSELKRDLLLTEDVRGALLMLANSRESLYGSSSFENDMEALYACSCEENPKLLYSLTLRISERKILQKLRLYAASRSDPLQNNNGNRSKRSKKMA